MLVKSPKTRYEQGKTHETVVPNDSAILCIETGSTGRIFTGGLIGSTAVAGYLLDGSGQSMLGISHISVGPDRHKWDDKPGSVSARFMRRMSAQGYMFKDLIVAQLLIATKSMTEGRQFPDFDNSTLVSELEIVADEIRALGKIKVDLLSYETPAEQYGTSWVEVVKSDDLISMQFATGLQPVLNTTYRADSAVPHP